MKCRCVDTSSVSPLVFLCVYICNVYLSIELSAERCTRFHTHMHTRCICVCIYLVNTYEYWFAYEMYVYIRMYCIYICHVCPLCGLMAEWSARCHIDVHTPCICTRVYGVCTYKYWFAYELYMYIHMYCIYICNVCLSFEVISERCTRCHIDMHTPSISIYICHVHM